MGIHFLRLQENAQLLSSQVKGREACMTLVSRNHLLHLNLIFLKVQDIFAFKKIIPVKILTWESWDSNLGTVNFKSLAKWQRFPGVTPLLRLPSTSYRPLLPWLSSIPREGLCLFSSTNTLALSCLRSSVWNPFP